MGKNVGESINKDSREGGEIYCPNSIKKNTVYNVMKTLSTLVFPLITFPYISRVLHAENIGKINFGSSIVNYIQLIASLGISTYAIRECSLVKQDKSKLSKTASEIMSINIMSTIISYAILGLLLLLWEPLEGYETLILIQSTSVLFITLGADWLNSSMEDFRYITIRTFAFQLISLIAMFIFVTKPEHYMIYALITVASTSGANLMNILYRRKYCKVGFTLHIDWKRHLKPVLLLFATLLSSTIFTSIDITMLGIMRGDVEVGWYSTSVNIYNMVNQVVASICWVVMPQLSYNFKKRDYIEINKILRYAASFIIELGMSALVGLYMLAPEVIELVGGKEYLNAVPSLRILTFALGFSFAGGFIFNIILLPSGRESKCLLITLVNAVINFTLNLVVIPVWGLNGAAATTALGQVIGFIIGLFLVEKEIDLGKKISLVRGPVIGSVVLGVYLVGARIILETLIARVFMGVLGGVLVYVAIGLMLKDEFMLNIFLPLVNKVKRRSHEE